MDVMHKIDALPALIIGRRDDNGVQTIHFDCSPWAEIYPAMSEYRLEMSINGVRFAPLRQRYNNGVLTWAVSEQDTAVAGAGRYEITATGTDGQRKTSASATVYVDDRIPGTALGVPPDYVAPLLDRIAEIVAGAGGGNVTPEQIQQAVDSYLADVEIVDNAARQGVQGNAEAISQLSEEMGKKQPAGTYVKTVNGSAPDANGNVIVSGPVEEDNIPDYWQSAVESAVRKIRGFQDEGGVDVFTFGFITDTHTDANNDGNFAKLMKRVMNDCKIPLCLHGGDYIYGSPIISKEKLIEQHLHNDYIFRNIEDKLLTAQGNHESVFGVNEYYDSNLTNAEIYDYVFRKNQGKIGIVFGDAGTYFYKDIPAQKVRYIVLNCYEFETGMDENQVVTSNNKLRISKFGSKQLTWFAEVALDVPEGYTAVVCSHNAPYRQDDLPQAWLNETTFMLDREVTLGIVNAYRNKTSYVFNGDIGSDTALETYALSFDFSQRKGEIACWVAGHTHMDGIFDIEGLKVVLTANCSGHIAVTDAPQKTIGTDTEYIMDFFCVNKNTKECNVVRLGATLEDGDGGEIVVVNNKADTDSDDWINNKRINSSRALVDGDGYAVSNFVPFAFGSTINLAGFGVMPNHTNLVFYKADTTTVFRMISYNDANAYMFSFSDNVISFDSSVMRNPGAEWDEAVYFRVSAPLSGTLDDVAIAVNEPIRFEPHGKPEGVRAFSY